MKKKSHLLAGCALAIGMFGGAPAAFADAQLDLLKEQVRLLSERIADLEREQVETKEVIADTRETVADTRDRAVLSTGKAPGSFILPGTNTEFQVGGYVKADLIYDLDESTGDAFVPESISVTDDNDDERFRAHARQSRLFVKTKTPSEFGDVKTLLEGDFFGVGGNEVFSNSASFRLRHAYGEIGGLGAGQFWTNFMPIESYPGTVDFNGPAGIPFIRQTQIRYTQPVSDRLTISGSLENSEFSGRDANGTFSESTGLGIRAGLDKFPDATLAATYRGDSGLIKLAGVGRILGSPVGDDEAFGYGVNLSGNTNLWEGGKLLGSFTFGDGVGRYILNGFGQDAFVDANGDIETIGAYGITAQVTQKVTDKVTLGLAYGRYEALDTFGPNDLEEVNTIHASAFYKPTDRVTLGGEVIWGNRVNDNGDDDDALRLQTSVQLNF